MQIAAPQPQPIGLIQMSAPLAQCVWGAIRDRAYKKAGGIKPSKFARIALLSIIVIWIVLVAGTFVIVSSDDAGTMTAFLILITFGFWEIYRLRVRIKNPVEQLRKAR
jgi:hypothetical protein